LGRGRSPHYVSAMGDAEVSLPKPYYEEEGIVIYNGDCLEILKHLGMVDITVSSPPYNQLLFSTNATGMHKGNKWVEKSGKGAGYAEVGDEMTYQKWQSHVFDLCRNRSKGLVWINHKVRFRDGEGIHPIQFYNWPFWSEVVWDRGVSMVLNARKFAPSHEYIYGFGKPHYWDDTFNTKMSVWRIAPQNSEDHPCPFPLELITPLIGASCPTDGIVLDPFMGSGTTLRAAKDLGRKAIGIEIEEKYCEIAVKRLAQEVLPL
jgi:site-specific DNA-methyltransferase (adenine-specific)